MNDKKHGKCRFNQFFVVLNNVFFFFSFSFYFLFFDINSYVSSLSLTILLLFLTLFNLNNCKNVFKNNNDNYNIRESI